MCRSQPLWRRWNQVQLTTHMICDFEDCLKKAFPAALWRLGTRSIQARASWDRGLDFASVLYGNYPPSVVWEIEQVRVKRIQAQGHATVRLAQCFVDRRLQRVRSSKRGPMNASSASKLARCSCPQSITARFVRVLPVNSQGKKFEYFA